jgi:hypothetical protein
MVSTASPGLNFFIRGMGEKGWTGWYDKPEVSNGVEY